MMRDGAWNQRHINIASSGFEALRRATQLSRMRMDYLDWAIQIENNPAPPQLQIRCFPPEPAET